MFWKRSINKIFFTTLIVFIAFILFSFSKTSIDNEVNAQNGKIVVLENRMNTFTSLPSGSTTGDAKVGTARNIVDRKGCRGIV